MNPDQLKETSMDPQSRTLEQITIEDIQKAKESLNTLMGSDVEIRREFINNNAFMVNLDSL